MLLKLIKLCDALAERLEPHLFRIILFDQQTEVVPTTLPENVIPLFGDIQLYDLYDDDDFDEKPVTMMLFGAALAVLISVPIALAAAIF